MNKFNQSANPGKAFIAALQKPQTLKALFDTVRTSGVSYSHKPSGSGPRP